MEVFSYLLTELKWIALAKAKDLSVTQFSLLGKTFNHNTGDLLIPNSMTFTQKFVISASKDMKRNETVLMQLSCWHNIKAADYGHLIEGNNNYDQ